MKKATTCIMKSLKSFKKPQDLSSEETFKDVVIVGNGPSGLAMSYFLSGHWPYVKQELIKDHPDELLKARLSYLDPKKSLVECDLESLSCGLDGRSLNPTSLLFDSLQHPGADLGLSIPSMLQYKYQEEKQISHIVLGKTSQAGGSWTKMPQQLRTLSLSSWMSLPGLDFDEWLKQNPSDISNHSSSNISEEVKTRAEVRCVAKYYSDYCKIMKLERFFKNDTIVFKITQPKKNENFNNSELENARWIVHSFDKITKKILKIGCNRIILANGSSDLANRLGVKGENNKFCMFDLPSLELQIENLKPAEKEAKLPVLVVGAGLSAADAVLFLRNKKIKVIHVYRSIAGGFLGLPPKIFPEYCSVLRMMRNPKVEHEFYDPMPETKVKEIKLQNGKHTVTVQSLHSDETQTFEVSFCAVLIGSSPDLQLLNTIKTVPSSKEQIAAQPDQIILQNDNFVVKTLKRLNLSLKLFCEKCRNLNLCSGYSKQNLINSLVEDSNEFSEIDETSNLCEDVKKNVLAVNKFSNELISLKGIFAMGPLVGDHFVRFISGGSLLICAAILKEI